MKLAKTRAKLNTKVFSRCIRQALEDVRCVERSTDHKIDMAEWFGRNGVCSVCMAGAVMARRYSKQVDAMSLVEPAAFKDPDLSASFDALDSLRCYSFRDAAHQFFPGEPTVADPSLKNC